MQQFTHIHVHSEHSVLDGLAKTQDLVSKAKEDGMKALALTDHGVMFGIKEFYDACRANEIKPLLGCETYVAANGIKRKESKDDRSGYHLILIAKNLTGYQNLLKLISIANLEGMYFKPRIDYDLLEKYHEGLIVSSACLGGDIQKKIQKNQMDEASERIEWFKNIFGDDFYLEIQRHKTDDPRMKAEVYDQQVFVNERMVALSKKHDVKLIATNDVHFTNEEDADAHDLLICVNTGKYVSDEERLRYTKQEWLKSQEEMSALFSDLPEAIENTNEIADKVEEFELDKPPIMPEYNIPESFGRLSDYRDKFSEQSLKDEFGEDAFHRIGGYESVLRVKFESDYLAYLVNEGAKKRYKDDLNDEVRARIDFEIETIKTMGFPGYFLIVQDFIRHAREMEVIVGPGRGSAAGSVVAYTTWITNIDPIKYDLLFERFLNPDRISMPDIDVDFDDDGRDKVLDWVAKKYGEDKVAHICTFGTMAAKLAIRDVARVLQLPLPEADRLAKLVPDDPKISFQKAYDKSPALLEEKNNENELVRKTLYFAEKIEGTVRQTGKHACGVLIGKETLETQLPLMRAKDAKLFVTQYDGNHVENIGLLKMDFLGLKTLSIIKECLDYINISKDVQLDIEAVELEDEKTFQLFSDAETTGIFQFESDGMKEHLRKLKPNHFEDLVAMNALHRPGPMENIPSYIDRKFGKKKIQYDHPMMENVLSTTYGITVYQEQVMLLSRHLAGFSRGQSDSLRKAMGKKKETLMNQLEVKFYEGCQNNEEFIAGCKKKKADPEKIMKKIWQDWKKFAKYAFNKSHSVSYAYVAYMTAYLKAHYPAEFMAAALSRNLNNIKKITELMDECRRMNIKVLGPCVNESIDRFLVDENNNIRFGLNAIKGMGTHAVEDIIEKRRSDGHFKDIYDFFTRVDLHKVNKRSLEALIVSGGFDCFDSPGRHQFFCETNNNRSFLEDLISYGNKLQAEQNSGQTIWGDAMEATIQTPEIPQCEAWSTLKIMKQEKEHIGMYLTAHPLDDYQFELSCLNIKPLSTLKTTTKPGSNEFKVAGYVNESYEKRDKRGKIYGGIVLEDYTDSYRFTLFSKEYIQFKNYLSQGYLLLISLKYEYWEKTQQYKLRIQSIEMLSSLRESYFSRLNLRLNLRGMDAGFIQSFEDVASKNKGKIALHFNIVDPETNFGVHLFSRKYQIQLSEEAINFIKNNPAIEHYDLN